MRSNRARISAWFSSRTSDILVMVKVETKNDWSDQINSHNQRRDTHSDRTSQYHEVRECQDRRSHQERLESQTRVHQTWSVSQQQMYDGTDRGALQPPLCQFSDCHQAEPFDHNVTNMFTVETITTELISTFGDIMNCGVDDHCIRGFHVINATRAIEWTNVVDEFHTQMGGNSQQRMYHCTDSRKLQPLLCHFQNWHKTPWHNEIL